MEASTFAALALACAPQVHLTTAHALVAVESAFNPWAIGVVGGSLHRQPRYRTEALATAQALQATGRNFSVGLGQINLGNFQRLGLSLESAFEPCSNLAAMQTVLSECFERAQRKSPRTSGDQAALHAALSCYYSGNFTTGFRHGYVGKVVAASRNPIRTSPPNPMKDPS
jgi:type IV secretion system protein VirB1